MEREPSKLRRTPSKSPAGGTKSAAGTTPSKTSRTPVKNSSGTPLSKKSAAKTDKNILGLDAIMQGLAVGPHSADWKHLKDAAGGGIRELVKVLLSEDPDIGRCCAAATTLILLFDAFPDELGGLMRREAIVSGALALLKGDDTLGQQLAAHIIYQHTAGSAGMLNGGAAEEVERAD